MNTSPFPLKPTESSSQLLYCVFSEEHELDLPENSSLRQNYINLQLNAENLASNLIYRDNIGIALGNFENYGTLTGLYWLWKNTNYPYVGFSLADSVLDISVEELTEFLANSYDILAIKPQACNCPLQENYRTLYYGYDFRMMLSVLKKHAPTYYTFAKEKWLSTNDFIPPTCIVKKEVLRKFCAWLFPILEQCHKHLPSKYSAYQNRFLEHLAYYLFMLYIKYNKEKLKINYSESFTKLIISNGIPAPSLTFANLKEYIQYLLDNRKVEAAYKHLIENKVVNGAEEILSCFNRYEKERRYHKTTIFEQTHNLDELITQITATPKPKPGTPKILIFEWNSITHKESILAFETLGFECHTYKTPYSSWIYDEDFLAQVNKHLDLNSFDMVFSVNYFAMVAEACYIHDVPYVAWCYDSPTYIGDLRYLRYPTNHVFLFDSMEAQEYISKGCPNVHYMPLAVNVNRLDNIICTPEETTKYQASISFVGSLYDNKLTSALNYLTDYQKGYLNALVDNQINTYGNDLFSSILSKNFMEWLSQPDFNRAIQSEWEKDKPSSETPSSGSLSLLLNKVVTNRERLLLITMLSNHWDFKLYSTSSSEVFNKVIQCGTVEYYQEMPKVFKNSRINLNITLRSIRAGIPQRCLDIMGSHGLLLTNYQKDFDEHFKDQENLLIYQSIEEAYEKARFYLNHETERKRIENNGYETVRKHFNYPDVLKKILHISELDYLLK